MAVIFTELFEGGADGVALTTANTNFTDFNGSGSAEFDTDLFVEGGTSGLFLEPRQAHGLVPSGGEFYLSEYVYFHVSVSGNFDFNLALDSDSIQARVQISADNEFRLVDAGNTVVGTTTHVMQPGQWYRVEWTIDEAAGTQDLSIYTGANLNSLTPTESLTGATYSGSATVDEFTYSRVSAAAVDMNIDRIILDDASMPAPLSTGTVDFAGDADSASNADADLSRIRGFAGAADTATSADATLSVIRALSGDADAASDADGTLFEPGDGTRPLQPVAAARPLQSTSALRTIQPDV